EAGETVTSRHPAYDLRRRYHARVRNAAAAAIVLHGIVFAVAPPYEPRPAGRASTPLRLVVQAGGWGLATASASGGIAAAPPEGAARARSLPAGASVVESRVTTESAVSAIPTDGTAATIRGSAPVQGECSRAGFSGSRERSRKCSTTSTRRRARPVAWNRTIPPPRDPATRRERSS